MLLTRTTWLSGGGWSPYQLFTWVLVAAGLSITAWQGWDCTQQYLAQPVRVEQRLVSLDQLPPIQLSFCQIFDIDHQQQQLPHNHSLTRGTVPLAATTGAAFGLEFGARNDIFHLAQLIEEIGFWNGSGVGSSWATIYDNSTGGSVLFDKAFYPYEGNSVLLCHTLRTGLGDWGTKFRIVTTPAVDTSEYSIGSGPGWGTGAPSSG